MQLRLLAALMLVSSAIHAQEPSGFVGPWRSQAQYQASVSGSHDPAAHAVVDLVIALEPNGRIRGASGENGCRWLGLATPYVTPTVMNLDITLSGCQHAALNRRFTGTITYQAKEGYSALRLASLQMGVGKVAAHYDIVAAIRR